MVFHLSSRQSEGLLRSSFALLKLDHDVPDHTTISRRKAKLGKVPFYQDTESGYSKRSKDETTFHRYKAIVGSAMRARGLAAQRVEARIGCKILNTMTALGMPDSDMIG